jgi:hypothetical protein
VQGFAPVRRVQEHIAGQYAYSWRNLGANSFCFATRCCTATAHYACATAASETAVTACSGPAAPPLKTVPRQCSNENDVAKSVSGTFILRWETRLVVMPLLALMTNTQVHLTLIQSSMQHSIAVAAVLPCRRLGSFAKLAVRVVSQDVAQHTAAQRQHSV